MSIFNAILGGTQGLGQGLQQRAKFQADEADRSYQNDDRLAQTALRNKQALEADRLAKQDADLSSQDFQDTYLKAIDGDNGAKANVMRRAAGHRNMAQILEPLLRNKPIPPRDTVADHKANRDYDIAHPLPTARSEASNVFQTGVDAEGRPTIFAGKSKGDPNLKDTGVNKPVAGAGGASIKKALATNVTQLSVIDDALKELDAHPDAVGLTRGLPIVGDRLDPRADPSGVAARASIANIGSLKIHDRSGAAVSVHEFPRLAPFIPAVSDPPAAIRVKLQKLRDAINVETDALRAQGGDAHSGTSVPDHTKLSDEEFAKQYKAGAFSRPP